MRSIQLRGPTEYQYETLVSAVGSEPVEVMAFSKTGANMGVQWSRGISSSTLFREDPGLKRCIQRCRTFSFDPAAIAAPVTL